MIFLFSVFLVYNDKGKIFTLKSAKNSKSILTNAIPRDMMYYTIGGIVWMFN